MAGQPAESMSTYRDEHTWIALTGEAPEVQQAVDFVRDPSCGAINTFVGTTRDQFDGRTVLRLYYDCYEQMALSETRKLIDVLRPQYGFMRAALLHRTGWVPVCHTGIVIAISAAHRKQAIEATLALLDRFKEKVPIWKKEVFEDEVRWKEQPRQNP